MGINKELINIKKMETKPKFKKTISRRKKEQLIVDDIYIFNLHKINKDKSKFYKCSEYKTIHKCKAFIKLDEKEEIINFSNVHNHLDNEIKAIHEETRKEIVNEINNTKDPFAIKIPRLVKSFSVDKGIKSPSFDSIKTTLYKEINKSFPINIVSFEDAPDESIYYQTISNQKFLLYKDEEVIIFQSEDQARIHAKHGNLVFCDATFYSAPQMAYQLFITRIYDETYNSFYTTSFSLMKNKSTEDYYKIFKKLDRNINQYLPINENYTIQELHTDFELAIGAAAKKIYKNITLKFCIWHLRRSMENKKNILCKSELSNDENLYTLYNIMCNLFLCDPEYVVYVFDIIKRKSDNDNFNNFLKYFETEYIKRYGINNWNYYENYRHMTNNACEAYNSKLNRLFDKKPTFYKLIYELRTEEADIVNKYKKRYAGLLGHEYRRSLKIESIINLINENIELINSMPNRTRNEKKIIGEKWFEFLKRIRLSNI